MVCQRCEFTEAWIASDGIKVVLGVIVLYVIDHHPSKEFYECTVELKKHVAPLPNPTPTLWYIPMSTDFRLYLGIWYLKQATRLNLGL